MIMRCNRVPRCLVTILMLSCMLCLGACGTGSANKQHSDNAWLSGESGERSASSLRASIQSVMNDPMEDSQRAMLKRALDHGGKVSHADYLSAWNNYKQCMVHKGYTEPPLQTVNGVVINLVHFNFSGVSEERQMKFHHDFGACFDRNVMYVESAYRDDAANPGLYRDLDVAMVDCLRRHELVPVEYTVAQYRRESDAFTNMTFDGEQLTQQQAYDRRRKAYSFDFDNPQVRTCVAGINPNAIADEIKEWRPFD